MTFYFRFQHWQTRKLCNLQHITECRGLFVTIVISFNVKLIRHETCCVTACFIQCEINMRRAVSQRVRHKIYYYCKVPSWNASLLNVGPSFRRNLSRQKRQKPTKCELYKACIVRCMITKKLYLRFLLFR